MASGLGGQRVAVRFEGPILGFPASAESLPLHKGKNKRSMMR